MPAEPDASAASRAEPPFTVPQLTSWADRPTFQIKISRSEADVAQHLFTPDVPTPPQ